MKKILFSILAVAAMSAACTKFAEDTIPTYDNPVKPTVTAKAVSDSSITVTITAGPNTSYFGYAVMVGTPGASAEELVTDGYAKSADVVLQGADNVPQAATIKYSEETSVVELTLTDLNPLTKYTVYAAAVTNMGIMTSVASASATTTDGIAPVMDIDGCDFQEADGVLTFAVPFDDPVSLTGKGTAKAYFYAENLTDERGYLTVYKVVDIPAKNMATSGNYLLLSVPASEYIPGAYVSMTYSAGVVANGSKGENAAFEDHLMAYIQGQLLWNGIVGQYAYANWDFSIVDPATLPDEPEGDEIEGEGDEEEEEKVPVYFSDWTSLVMPNYTTSKYPLYDATSDAEIKISTAEADGKTVSYFAKRFGVVSDKVVGIMLNEAPAYGSTVSYVIAEGSFCDIFGNENNEFEAEDEYFCSYGYTIEDIVGPYQFTAQSAYDGSPVSGTWTIVESDNAEKGNVMFTEMYSTECIANVYATFDMVSGKLTIPSLQLYSANDKYLFAFCSSSNSGEIAENDVVFAVPQAGVINGQSCLFGDAAFDPASVSPLGFFAIYVGFQAIRTETASAVAKAPAKTRAIRKF